MCLFAEKGVILQPMKRFWLHIIYIYMPAVLLLAAFAACGDDPVEPEPTPVVPGRPGVKLSRTLIVYMAGENSLSDFVQYDSLEISEGLSTIGVDHRVVLFIDDAKSSRICAGMREPPLRTLKTYSENICSTDSADMERVLKDIVAMYPAEHYGLILWSHGSGWVPSEKTKKAPRRSYGIDNGLRNSQSNEGVKMNITTLARVLEHLPHTDFLLFDACFMQCIEVAYQLRTVTDYVIGSPAEIPGAGAAYVKILQSMCQVPANINRMLNDYVDYYLNGEGQNPYSGAELTAIRTSELETLASASAPYLQRIFRERQRPDCTGVQKYYYGASHLLYTEFYDFKNLMFHHLSTEEYVEWCKAYEAAVPYAPLTPTWYSIFSTASNHLCRITDMENTGGVSLFVQSDAYTRNGWTEKYHEYDWYTAVGMETTGW